MSLLFSIKQYLNYLIKSTNQHGVHSPFVYELLTKVIYAECEKPLFAKIEHTRKKLLKNNSEITVTDFGAGSKISNQRIRSVSSITKSALKRKKYAQLLYRLVEHFKPVAILELGTSLGISTMYMAAANKNASIHTIEGSAEIAKIAQDGFNSLGFENITTHIGNFDEILPQLLTNLNSIDFIFIDGNHRKEPTLNYFNQLLKKANNNTVFIFDDIYWSPEMMQAWHEIMNHPQVTVSIDLFEFGLVFIRKEQVKEHFILRF